MEKKKESHILDSDNFPNQKRSKLHHSDASIHNSLSSDKLISLTSNDDNYILEDTDQHVEVMDKSIITHEKCFPPNFDHEMYLKEISIPPETIPKPAKLYDFVLDPFQQESLQCLELGESILLSAHTSAGKTVVAEYAIAMSLRDHQRVIYTSPIKALSNQKYRELYEEFEDVGLMTGDVTINPSASCLVMTTEILRNMLYRGSEVMREVAWVIFDEIHYMRDKERGVVWEESIIFLPDTVRFVFLSATIPNATEFASWVAKLHRQPCNVIYTEMRPVPLQHYIFPTGSDGLYLIVDENSNFREENYMKALSFLQNAPRNKRRKGIPLVSMYKIVNTIMERNYYPCIVFSFSKRECEQYALQMSNTDFTSNDEKKLISTIFNNAMDSLTDEDKKLKQVQNILPLLKRGIGIHHGGLLPILKEVIEILFQEGLLKVLFSTETFSLGLNMPAKTVIFTSLSKFDGQSFRMITSGEYIQMGGRAGRRGIDQRGIVILMIDEYLEPSVAKKMLRGQPDPLNSTFHLGYNMLLNLLRVQDADPDYLIKRSFFQYQKVRSVPNLQKKIYELKEKLDDIKFPPSVENDVAQYYHLKSELSNLSAKMHEELISPNIILPFLNPGRLVKIIDNDIDWGWGVIVSFQKIRGKTGSNLKSKTQDMSILIDVMLPCDPDVMYSDSVMAKDPKKRPVACPPGKTPEYIVIPCTLRMIHQLSSIRLYLPKELRKREFRDSVGKSLNAVSKRFVDGIPILDPVEDMKIDDNQFTEIVRKVENLEDQIHRHKLFTSIELMPLYNKYETKMKLQEEINAIKKEIREVTNSASMKKTLNGMKTVLKRLEHIDDDNVLTLKGRAGCEISTSDELVATELIFSGAFNELPVDVIVAMISCLVFDENVQDSPKLPDSLGQAHRKVIDVIHKIATIAEESISDFDRDAYIGTFKSDLMNIVSLWCKGNSFSQISKSSSIFEGTIIRTIRRLEELLNQLKEAAKVIGNNDLEKKFSEGIEFIRRDIVFAASLYL